ncbi:hypothetical protein MKW92_051616 [Papaver armeniacum]|nr:hypothetical protein MKW92_051616 [Papaver armeniacum]
MQVESKGKILRSSNHPSWIFCFPSKYFSSPVSTKKDPAITSEDSKTIQRKPAGWKAMPYIIGNETFERLASYGLIGNFMVYLLTHFNMNQIYAANLLTVWAGTTNFAPLIGAFLSDAYLGRFKTLAYASFISFTGLLVLTLTAAIPDLYPPSCTSEQLQHAQCIGPSKSQLGFLFLALGLLTVGAGGIRPCSIPFGVDQFDPTTDEGKKGITSFFNWYYFSFTVVIIIALTVLVYIQGLSWVWGLAILTFLMFCAIVLFFAGTRIYVYIQPDGSVFSGIVQVFVAAYKKRKLKLPSSFDHAVDEHVLYDPPLKGSSTFSKIPYTNQFRILNKAAIIENGGLKPDGTPVNKWRLCSIQQVEELKCIIRAMPICVSGIICFTAIVQQHTFTVLQALKMNRHLGPKFQIPAGSLSVISMITIALWLPIYDRILVPNLRKITKKEGGITILQRMGIGLCFSVFAMIAAGFVEKKRRESAIVAARPDGIAPITVLWLALQLVLMGLAEAFNVIGQIEFYNKEFPEHMLTVSNSLLHCSIGAAFYFSSFLVAIVHEKTSKNGSSGWFDNKNINNGRLENFYFLIGGLGAANFMYFLFVAHLYRYKGSAVHDDDVSVKKAVLV